MKNPDDYFFDDVLVINNKIYEIIPTDYEQEGIVVKPLKEECQDYSYFGFCNGDVYYKEEFLADKQKMMNVCCIAVNSDMNYKTVKIISGYRKKPSY